VRYTSRFRVADFSGSLFAVGFDGPANQILKKSAEDIKILQETDEMKLSAYIKTILNFEYEIGIKMNKRLD